MSNALLFQGSSFDAVDTSDTTGTTVTNIGEVTGSNGPNGQAAEINVTHSKSVAKEFKMGLQDWGTLALTMNMLSGDPGQDLLLANRAGQVEAPYRITFNTTPTLTWDFNAFVLSYAISGQEDQKFTATSNLRISGDITIGTA